MGEIRRHGSGRLVGSSAGHNAFIPDPLPPRIDLGPQLVRALSEADLLVGRLSGEGRTLPNPHLLMRPFVRREAVLSSRIEGTQATLGELLASDAGAAVVRSPNDIREVANYVVALEHGLARLQSLPLSLRLVGELHEKLMRGVRGDHAAPGEFRRSQNRIGPPGASIQNATYVPPPVDQLMTCLGDWEHFLHDRSLPPLIQIALIHYQFEAIHPFLDGNGRVGRLLIPVFLAERDILPTPLLYVSAFFEATRRDYYERLAAVSHQAAWEEWIIYFLRAVACMSQDALGRAQRINSLLVHWRRSVAGAASKTPAAIVDLLAENPYWTTRKVAERLGVAFTTAQRGIEKLISLNILRQVGETQRDRVFCAERIMSILDEPAHLEGEPGEDSI